MIGIDPESSVNQLEAVDGYNGYEMLDIDKSYVDFQNPRKISPTKPQFSKSTWNSLRFGPEFIQIASRSSENHAEPWWDSAGQFLIKKLEPKNPEKLTQKSKIQSSLTFLFRDRIQ